MRHIAIKLLLLRLSLLLYYLALYCAVLSNPSLCRVRLIFTCQALYAMLDLTRSVIAAVVTVAFSQDERVSLILLG